MLQSHHALVQDCSGRILTCSPRFQSFGIFPLLVETLHPQLNGTLFCGACQQAEQEHGSKSAPQHLSPIYVCNMQRHTLEQNGRSQHGRCHGHSPHMPRLHKQQPFCPFGRSSKLSEACQHTFSLQCDGVEVCKCSEEHSYDKACPSEVIRFAFKTIRHLLLLPFASSLLFL